MLKQTTIKTPKHVNMNLTLIMPENEIDTLQKYGLQPKEVKPSAVVTNMKDVNLEINNEFDVIRLAAARYDAGKSLNQTPKRA